MKEKVYKIISYGIAIILVFCTLWSCGKVVNAAVPSTQIVQIHSATWSNYNFSFSVGGNYWTIEDSTGIPASTTSNPNFFYTHDGIKFDLIEGKELFTWILNNNLGIILKDSVLSTVYNGFLTAIQVLDSNNQYYQGALYGTNNTFLGYCLNDIKGCYFAQNSTDGFDYDRTWPDNIDNYYDYYSAGLLPDFITYYPPSKQTVIQNYKPDVGSDTLNNLEQLFNDYPHIWLGKYNQNQNYYWASQWGNYDGKKCYAIPDLCYCTSTEYSSLCNKLELTSLINSFTQYDLTKLPIGQINSSLTWYKVSDNTTPQQYAINIDTMTATTTTFTAKYFFYENPDLCGLWGENLTIYKDTIVSNQVKNETYIPNQYITDSYNDYQSNNQNSFNTTKQNVDNSVTNNNNIYNEASDSFYEYVDNSVVDSNNITNNVTNITNNYYGSGGGDNPDSPDNPDDPDSPVLDEILRAILRFFNVIGDIIGTLLASILNLIDSVLEALSGVMENLDGMSDFFASLFAWIPEPVPQILGAGFGICLVCGIIKFIRG